LTEYQLDLEPFTRWTYPTLPIPKRNFGKTEYSGYNVTSTFFLNGTIGHVDLPAPSLNITEFEIARQVWIPPEGARHLYAYAFGSREVDVYNATYLSEHGSCKPSEMYQWGFSYIFLFMVSIFNFVWTCIVVAMWLDTRRGSRMYRSGRRPGLLRSIMDYSAAIREELGNGTEHLSEEELRKRLTQSGGGLLVPKSELKVTRADTGEDTTKQRGWKRGLTRGSTF
jgi:hypothetical protein